MDIPLPPSGCPLPRRPNRTPPPSVTNAPAGSNVARDSTVGPSPPPSSSLWPLSAVASPQGPASGRLPPQPRWRRYLAAIRKPLSVAERLFLRRGGWRPHGVWVASLAALAAVAIANAAILLHHAALRCYHPVTATLVHIAGPEAPRLGAPKPPPTYGDPRYYVSVRNLQGRPPAEEVKVPRFAPSVGYGGRGRRRRRWRQSEGKRSDREFFDDLRMGINAPLVVYLSQAKKKPVLEPPGGFEWRRAVGWVTAGIAAAAAGGAIALAVADWRGMGTAVDGPRLGRFSTSWRSGRGGDVRGEEDDIVWMGDWVAWADAAEGGGSRDGRDSASRDGGWSVDRRGDSRAGPTRPPRLAEVDDPGGSRLLGGHQRGGGGSGGGGVGGSGGGGGGRRRLAGLAPVEIEGILAAGAVRPAAFGATDAAIDWSCAICLDGLPAESKDKATGTASGGVSADSRGTDEPPPAGDDVVGDTLAAVRSWVAAARRGSVAVPVRGDIGTVRAVKGAAAAGRPPLGLLGDGDWHDAAGGGAGPRPPPRRLVRLPCNHVFHARCLRRWLVLGSAECPLCKQVLQRRGKDVAGRD